MISGFCLPLIKQETQRSLVWLQDFLCQVYPLAGPESDQEWIFLCVSEKGFSCSCVHHLWNESGALFQFILFHLHCLPRQMIAGNLPVLFLLSFKTIATSLKLHSIVSRNCFYWNLKGGGVREWGPDFWFFGATLSLDPSSELSFVFNNTFIWPLKWIIL